MFIKQQGFCKAINSDHVWSIGITTTNELVAYLAVSGTGENGVDQITLKKNATQSDFDKLLKTLNKTTTQKRKHQ